METLKFVMTTTFYPPYHIGGDAVHVYHLSNELSKLGHDVHVIHSIDSYRWQRKGEPIYKYPSHEDVTIYALRSPIGKISPLISYISGLSYPITKKIRDIVHEIRPDILHHHNIAGLGASIFDIKASKVLYSIHDYWLTCPMNMFIKYDGSLCKGGNCFICSILSKRPPQLWRYTNSLNKKINNIDTMIAPSTYAKNRFKELGIKGNFIVISNFIPPKSFEMNVPLYNFPYFLFVGVLEKHKGVLNIIDTFLNLRDKIDAKLLIVGNGSLENRIKNIITKNNCKKKILLLGRIDDLALMNIYTNAIAIIVPSIWPENCPMVALEALSVGVPVIGTCNGGLREIIEKIDKRLLLSRDIRDISEKVLNFDPKLYPKNDMLDIFENNYSFNQYYKKYIRIINR